MCCCLFGCSTDEDSPLKHRQIDKRSCTDLLPLLIFIIFCVGLGFVCAFAWQRGDYYRIRNGADSFGNTCGKKNTVLQSASQPKERFPLSGKDMTEKPFMFGLNVTDPLSTLWICVDQCPNTTYLLQQSIRDDHLCLDDDFLGSISFNKSRRDELCAAVPVLATVPVFNRCIPEEFLKLADSVQGNILKMVKNNDFVRRYLNDVIRTRYQMLQCLAIALGLSAVMIILLRLMAPIVVYFVYALIIFIFIGIAGGLWYGFYLMHVQAISTSNDTSVTPTRGTSEVVMNSASFLDDIGLSSWFRFENTSSTVVFGLAIGATVIALFATTCVWCMLPRGALLVDLFKMASSAIFDMPVLLLQPIFTAISLLILLGYSLFVLLLLYTAGDPSIVYQDDSVLANYIVEYNATTTTKILAFYQFVGFVWLSEFFMGCQRLILAGALATWYFDKNRRNIGAVCSSFYRLVRYHLGSVAFGSFVITLIRVPRYVLMYIYAKMKAVENPIVKTILACFICILSCIESCLRYMTYNAFTVIAYSGQSFCPACKTATNLLLDNAVNLATVKSIGDFILFLAKVAVASSSAAVAFSMIQKDPEVSHWWFPVLLVFIASYIIANCFLSVYAMAIDALFLCYSEDKDLSSRTDGADFYNPDVQEYLSHTMERERSVKSRNRRRVARNTPPSSSDSPTSPERIPLKERDRY